MSALAELRYAPVSEGAYFAEWCERHLEHSVDQFAGRPVAWELWQRDFFDELMAADEDGTPYWSSAALVVSRKNGKTAMLAALALYRLMEDEGQPEILLAAASDKQAGRLFDAVVSYLRRAPELDERVHRREYVGAIVNVETGGKIIRLPSSGETLDGFNPSLAICDELHAWSTPTRRRVWTSLNTGGAARRRTQVVTITTAGDALARETSILGRLIDGNERDGDVDVSTAGLTVSRNHKARTLMFNYSAPTDDPSDVAAMKLANPASWVSEEFLERQAANAELTDAEVLQLHGCVWAAGSDQWIDPAAWEACREAGVVIPDGARVAVGVDVGIVHDATAVAVAWPREDGRVVLSCRFWKPDPGRPVQLSQVEDHIRDLADTFRVGSLCYDPHFFVRSAQELESVVPMVEVAQSSGNMAEALQGFYSAVLERGVVHPGIGDLTAHVLGATAERTERGWKVGKLRQSQKIDGLVASVLACYAVEVMGPEKRAFRVRAFA